jgi:hypothetical protein
VRLAVGIDDGRIRIGTHAAGAHQVGTEHAAWGCGFHAPCAGRFHDVAKRLVHVREHGFLVVSKLHADLWHGQAQPIGSTRIQRDTVLLGGEVLAVGGYGRRVPESGLHGLVQRCAEQVGVANMPLEMRVRSKLRIA